MKTQNTLETPPNVSDEAKALKAKAIQVQIETENAEYNAFLEADRATQALASQSGSNLRSRLAREVGQSVKSKVGRPEVGPYRRLHSAILASGNATFKEIARCYAISSGAIGTAEGNTLSEADIKDAKAKHVTGKGRAEDGKGSVTLRMAKPLAIAITFGE